MIYQFITITTPELSLMFSLLKQSWMQSQAHPDNYNLSNDVLLTARDLLSALPPLSLAVDTKIPPIGNQTLTQVYQRADWICTITLNSR